MRSSCTGPIVASRHVSTALEKYMLAATNCITTHGANGANRDTTDTVAKLQWAPVPQLGRGDLEATAWQRLLKDFGDVVECIEHAARLPLPERQAGQQQLHLAAKVGPRAVQHRELPERLQRGGRRAEGEEVRERGHVRARARVPAVEHAVAELRAAFGVEVAVDVVNQEVAVRQQLGQVL